ncbi:hypothetical protein HDV64DRAFT_38749 [Trichoderma sp. TUCIM 5745]
MVVMENTKSLWVKHTLWSTFFTLLSALLSFRAVSFFPPCSRCVYSDMSCRVGAKTMRICGCGTCMCSPLTRALEAMHRSLVTWRDAK